MFLKAGRAAGRPTPHVLAATLTCPVLAVSLRHVPHTPPPGPNRKDSDAAEAAPVHAAVSLGRRLTERQQIALLMRQQQDEERQLTTASTATPPSTKRSHDATEAPVPDKKRKGDSARASSASSPAGDAARPTEVANASTSAPTVRVPTLPAVLAAQKPSDFQSWSDAKQRAWDSIKSNPNGAPPPPTPRGPPPPPAPACPTPR